MAKDSPLSSEERTRFKTLASTIDFSGLQPLDQLTGKSMLAGFLFDDRALELAPSVVNNTPNIPARIKDIFNAAFDAARKTPTMANGASLPKQETVVMVAAIFGLLVGAGLAVMIVD